MGAPKKKGKPTILGKPERGDARQLTADEAVATGLTRKCLVYHDTDGEIHLLTPRNSTKTIRAWSTVNPTDIEWAIQQLENFWTGN
jgi:hypothetical protein